MYASESLRNHAIVRVAAASRYASTHAEAHGGGRIVARPHRARRSCRCSPAHARPRDAGTRSLLSLVRSSASSGCRGLRVLELAQALRGEELHARLGIAERSSTSAACGLGELDVAQALGGLRAHFAVRVGEQLQPASGRRSRSCGRAASGPTRRAGAPAASRTCCWRPW